jgi:general stress protein YciG
MDTATRMRSNGGKARAKLDKAVLSAIGRKGGKARAAAMSPDERRESARKAVNVRWKRVRDKAKLSAHAVALGRNGGKARRAALSPARRSEIARQAVTTHWDRVRAAKVTASAAVLKTAKRKRAAGSKRIVS